MKHILYALLVWTALVPNAHAQQPAPFKVAYFDNYAPYSWLDDNGKMRGIFIDILDRVIRDRMNRPILHQGLPWARAQQYVKTGEYDAIVAPITAERQKYANISQQPVLKSRMTIFARASHPQMPQLRQTRSLNDIQSFDFVTQLGDGWAKENLSDMNVQYVADLDTVLRMLSLDRADLFIEASLVTHWNLKNLGLSDEISEVEGVTIEETAFHLMVSKHSSQQIIEEFDRHLRALIEDGEFEKILEKYKQ